MLEDFHDGVGRAERGRRWDVLCGGGRVQCGGRDRGIYRAAMRDGSPGMSCWLLMEAGEGVVGVKEGESRRRLKNARLGKE